MPSSLAKDAMQLRSDMKGASRTLINLYEQLSLIAAQYIALGIKYDGTIAGTTADPEAVALVTALNTVYTTIDANKQAIFRGADIGGNIT
jgi:hypothetical protein